MWSTSALSEMTRAMKLKRFFIAAGFSSEPEEDNVPERVFFYTPEPAKKKGHVYDIKTRKQESKKAEKEKRAKKMPASGMNPAARADAHLRWAERYDSQSNTPKAAAHFGRALEYDRRAKLEKRQKFGTNDWEGGSLGMHENMRNVANAANLALAAGTVATTLVTAAGAVAANNLYELYKSLLTPSEPVPNPKILSYSLLRQLQEKQSQEKAKQLQGAAPQLVAAAPVRTLSLGPGSGGVGTNALAKPNLPPNRQVTPVQKPQRPEGIATAPKPEPEAKVPEMQVIRAEEQHRLYFSKLKEVIDSIDIKNKKLLLEYTEECIKAHAELQESKQEAGVIASAASWLMGTESHARKRAKAFEQAINALLSGEKGPMNVPPEKQHDVEDRHSNAYTTRLESKGLLQLRSDVLCSREPYNNWPGISCMKQALSDIYVIVEDADFAEKERQKQKK